MSGGVSVLCLLAATVAIFYGNLRNLVIRSKSVIKSSSDFLKVPYPTIYRKHPETNWEGI